MADGWRGLGQRDMRLVDEELSRIDAEVAALGERIAGHGFRPGQPGATEEMAADYASALDAYERAEQAMPGQPASAVQALEDGRYALAALDARLAGEPLPERLALCFFGPRHGRAVRQVRWAPEGGVERLVAVCAADAVRLADGQRPITTATHRGAVQPPVRQRVEPAADRAAAQRGRPDGGGRDAVPKAAWLRKWIPGLMARPARLPAVLAGVGYAAALLFSGRLSKFWYELIVFPGVLVYGRNAVYQMSAILLYHAKAIVRREQPVWIHVFWCAVLTPLFLVVGPIVVLFGMVLLWLPFG